MTAGTLAGGFTVDFELTDHHGRQVRRASYGERYLLVYFGFTNCAEVCPRSLERLTHVLDELGEERRSLVPILITVDPDRDSPDALREYLEAHYPRFTGLTGTRAQLDAARVSFRAFARRREPDSVAAGYAVAHSAFAYLVAPSGKVVAHFGDSASVEAITAEVRGALGGDHTRIQTRAAQRTDHVDCCH
ncbi:SCO family protein [Microbacterium sp. HD4P20]|uniref:SCO family protein n=1 Tax=Microbacterium sp. HD4P20 TaxID=2864874 RepID=UPI001C6423ED|nr:SCO family protein [Microbacterium sp. HD4P20]MCP2637193.1 SCO family protein [Microbacterium sp. HD4P20]